MLAAYERRGAAGLAHGQRGRPSNRKLAEPLRELAVSLVRTHYSDFGPTFAHEKLSEVHGLELSVSTLRTWRVEESLWVPRSQRHRRIHQPRVRRECYGELIQIDGSDHHWFEDRGPRCTLLVFIDDATGSLMALRFCDGESTFNYFEAAKDYLEAHGKPVAFYSDKASGPLRPDEDLTRVFTWQEQRKVTRSLTVHYKRRLYIIDKSPEARDAMGKQVDVVETVDGAVTLRFRGRELPAQEFDKEGHVRQAAIVENKLLSRALEHAKNLQEQRDEAKLRSSHVTKRDKRLLRERRARAAAL